MDEQDFGYYGMCRVVVFILSLKPTNCFSWTPAISSPFLSYLSFSPSPQSLLQPSSNSTIIGSAARIQSAWFQLLLPADTHSEIDSSHGRMQLSSR